MFDRHKALKSLRKKMRRARKAGNEKMALEFGWRLKKIKWR